MFAIETYAMIVDAKRIKKVDAPACMLGEGPMWHSGRGSAFWLDILENNIFEYHPIDGTVKHYTGAQMISMICQISGNNDVLVAGAIGGVGTYDLRSQQLSLISDLSRDWEDHRCNDGAVDSAGNLLIGTTHVDHEPEEGDLYRVNGNWQVAKTIGRLSISNGICWSADGETMYHTDSPTREVNAFRYDKETGVVMFDRLAIQIPESMGFPDGMSMDSAGTIWIAIWGGSGVGGFNSLTGQLEQWIPLPAPHVSSCAFVGAELDYLLVTTAQKEMTKEELASYPDSGSVFLIKMDVPGLPVYDCTLPIRKA